MLRKSRALASVAVVLVTAGLGGCGGSADSGDFEDGDYVVGVADHLSGPLAVYGNYTLTHIRAAAEYFNDRGGINGHRVRVVSADMSASGANATSAAQQLITADRVNVLAGFALSAFCGQVAPLAEELQVPQVCYSLPLEMSVNAAPYTFGGFSLGPRNAQPSIDFIVDELGLGEGTSFATYSTDATASVGYIEAVTGLAEDAGMERVSDQAQPVAKPDGTTEIANLVTSDPELVIAFPATSAITPLVKSLRAAGNDAPIIMPAGAASYADIVKLADPNLYVLSVTQFTTDLDSTDEGQRTLIDAMTLIDQGTPERINQVLGNVAFPQAYALMLGLERCGWPCDGPGLQEALDQTDFEMPGLFDGRFVWSPDRHDPLDSIYMFRYDPEAKQPEQVAQLSLGEPSEG